MTAIAGASAGVKDMADGSLRITIEFEPKDAKEAFELFGSRGTPVALAALRAGFAAVPDAPKEPPVKVGPLCREAIDLCKMPEFHGWLKECGEGSARLRVLEICKVLSRKQLDQDERGAQLFREQIRVPFMRHMKQRQAA